MRSAPTIGACDPRALLHPRHETIHHPLLPRLVEMDGQLVAVDPGDIAIADFPMKGAGRLPLEFPRHQLIE